MESQLKTSYDSIIIKDVLVLVGDNHSLQRQIIICLCLFFFCNGINQFSFPYVFNEPTYECKINGVFEACNEIQACSKEYEIKLTYGAF